MDRWNGKVALVTGASSGIGAAITKALVRHGMIVVGCARRVDMIKAIQKELQGEKGKLHPIKCDLTKKEDITALFKEIKEQYKVVDVCINDAGLGLKAPLIGGDPDDWRTMMEVNVMALCHCTQESLKLMREENVDDGQIIHMNSMSGHRVSGYAFYSATKYMVTALTEGLRRELRAEKSKIRISSISPGFVETEFGPRAIGEDPATSQYYTKLPAIKTEDVADQVVHILKQPANVQIHDILLRPVDQAT